MGTTGYDNFATPKRSPRPTLPGERCGRQGCLSARDSVTATAIRSTATSAPRTSVCLDWLDLGSAAHRGKLLYLEGSLITFGYPTGSWTAAEADDLYLVTQPTVTSTYCSTAAHRSARTTSRAEILSLLEKVLMTQAGRIVIVTGAAGGIGRALVNILAADTVIAVDLPGSGVVELARGLGEPHLGLECDVSREEDIVALYGRVEAQLGQISVLINNAGVGPTMAATVDTDVDDFRRGLAVNLIGPFLMAREGARRMRPGGAIVKRNAYAASKAGLISLTKSLACEWASRGIRVAAVAPGCVRTPMIAELGRAGKIDLAAMRRRVPMGRLARPDEIARVVSFLASVQACYVTGSVLAVDGGWMSFNQPGDASPEVEGALRTELSRPAERTDARVVLVTGGANGIGAAVALRFAANGDTVVIADKDSAAATLLAALLGGKNTAKSVDAAIESEVVALFEGLRGRFGRLDILVNGASIDTFAAGVEQMPAEIERVLHVNLTGAFTCAREAIKMMRPGGVILNLGSINSFPPFACLWRLEGGDGHADPLHGGRTGANRHSHSHRRSRLHPHACHS